MFCNECGAQNPDTNQFCRNCGKPLKHHPPAAAPAAAAAPAPAPVSPPAPAPGYQPAQPVAPAAAPAPAPAPKRPWNLLGILSFIVGLLSWGILTVILAIVAILLGIISLVLFRKKSGRIGISSVLGIILAIGALAALVLLA